MEKVAPDIALPKAQVRSATGVSSRRTSAPRSPPSSTASPASTPPAIGANGTSSASAGQRVAMPRKVLQRTYSTRFNDFALEFYSFVADNYAPFYSRPGRVQRPRRALRARRRASTTRALEPVTPGTWTGKRLTGGEATYETRDG